MKIFLILLLLSIETLSTAALSSEMLNAEAFAYQENVTGKIFLGGFTFSPKNYLPTSVQIEKAGQTIQIKLTPLAPYENCIIEFGAGILESSSDNNFAHDLYFKYKIPVIKSCPQVSNIYKAKIYRLVVGYKKDTQEIKFVGLSPYFSRPSTSIAYFSTNF